MNIVNPYRYATSLTYISAAAYTVDGKAAELLDATDKIVVADDDTLSFGNGSSDSAFSISVWVQRNTTANQVINCKRKNDGTANEYMLLIVGGDLWFRCFSGGSISNYIRAYVDYNYTLPGGSSIVNWLVTYDGSGVNSGLKIYEDGVLATTINDTVGTYTAMTNDVGDFSIGHAYSQDGATLNGRIEELYIFNKELDATEAEFVYDEGAARRTLI